MSTGGTIGLRAVLVATMVVSAWQRCAGQDSTLIVIVLEDEYGNPLPKAKVYVHPAGSSTGIEVRITDEHGRASFANLAPRPKRYDVDACAVGFSPNKSKEELLTPGQQQVEIRLTHSRMVKISGTVRGPTGSVVSGAEVRGQSQLCPFGDPSEKVVEKVAEMLPSGRYEIKELLVAQTPVVGIVGKALGFTPTLKHVDVGERSEVRDADLKLNLLSAGNSSVTGTVTDASGGVVPETRVTVNNVVTSAARDAVTNDDGDFTVALLPPGHYRVTVEKDGFRRAVLADVGLDVDQTARMDFTLQVGALTEEAKVGIIKVSIIQTDTSTLGQVINGRLVYELPLNERNFLAFALLAPGSQLPAEGSQNSTQGGAVSVNGAREQSNNFLLEGVDNVALPSIEAVQEFKVQSTDYAAEFGRSGGARVNVILKGGSNQFHGGVFEFLRNRNLDAKNYFDQPYCTPGSVQGTCGPIPSFDRDQFGGTFGGPIRKDKTFFFVSYESLRLRQATTREATVPSQTQLSQIEGLLSGVGIPLNPAGQAILNLYPAANVGSDLANSNTFVSTPVIRNTENLGLVKVDHHAGPDDTLSAHWAIFDENRFNPFDPVYSFTNLPGYGSYTLNDGQNGGLSWTHVFTSAAINEFRVGYNRMRAGALQQSYGKNVSAQLGFPDVLTNPVDLGYLEVNLLGFDGIGEPLTYPQDRHDTTVHLSDNLSWIKGRNQFKFGADIRDIQIDNYLDFVARGDFFF